MQKTRFELQTSVAGSDHSANKATTTKFDIKSMKRIFIRITSMKVDFSYNRCIGTALAKIVSR